MGSEMCIRDRIILIIVVLVGLVIIFKGQIVSIVNSLFEKITDRTGKF